MRHPASPRSWSDLKDRMLDLVEAERITIFALDTKNQELFSLFKAGQEVREIRVPKSFSSIAGFTALARRTVNIADVYDAAQLAALHASLRFDARWDKRSGFKTTQILSTPMLFDKYLLGVLQLDQQARRRQLLRQGRERGRGAGQDPRHRLLQPAPGRAQQQALEVRRAGRQGGRLREGHREGGLRRARQPDSRWPRSWRRSSRSRRRRSSARSGCSTAARPGGPGPTHDPGRHQASASPRTS